MFIGHDLGPKMDISRSLALRSGGSVLSVISSLSGGEEFSKSAKGKVLRKIVLEGNLIGSDERIGLLRAQGGSHGNTDGRMRNRAKC